VTITLTTDNSAKLKLITPYVPYLPARYRALGGKWNPIEKAWYFDPRDSDRVRDLCVEVFGIDPLAGPDEQPEMVTVRLHMDAWETRTSEIWLFGRDIVSQPSRDAPTRFGRGVVVVHGEFAGGGSRANPAMNAQPGTIIEIRDVPRPLADEQVRKWAAYAEELSAMAAERETRLGQPMCDPSDIASLRKQAEEAASAVQIIEPVDPAPAGELTMAEHRACQGCLDGCSLHSTVHCISCVNEPWPCDATEMKRQTLLFVADDLRRTAEAHLKSASIEGRRLYRKHLIQTANVLIEHATSYEQAAAKERREDGD
jgi:hypothetical protein